MSLTPQRPLNSHLLTCRAVISSGNLATKSLAAIVPPDVLVQDSEYLETHLIAVPNSLVKDFLKSYETLSPMVVPRSGSQIAKDDEFTLFAVVTFKKHAADFVHKCREKRWTPRDFKYKEGSKEEEAREVDRLEKEERKVWGEALRLGRTGYSESAMIWIHVLALRVFVETVLRYGLPLEFICGLVQVRNPSFPYLSITGKTGISWKANIPSDHRETRQQGKDKPRRKLLVPWRQRLRQGQAGPRQEGRLGRQCGAAGSGPRRCRVHALCLLRVRDSIVARDLVCFVTMKERKHSVNILTALLDPRREMCISKGIFSTLEYLA